MKAGYAVVVVMFVASILGLSGCARSEKPSVNARTFAIQQPMEHKRETYVYEPIKGV